MVPCDPIRELNMNYGHNWLTAEIKNYSFNSMDRKPTNWTEKQWLHVYRFYFPNGTFDEYKTLLVMDNFKMFPEDPSVVNPLPKEPEEDDVIDVDK